MSRACVCLVFLFASVATAQDLFLSRRSSDDPWDKVRQAMHKYPLIHNAMLTVGDDSGELFNYAIGSVTRDTKMQMYSSTKWVTATAILKEYERGVIDLDAHVSKYLPFWTTDPEDIRYNTTLRHIMGFSDGFTADDELGDVKLAWFAATGHDLQGCARAIYNNMHLWHAPGSIIDYNSEHLTLAGAAVEMAVGEPIINIIKRNVFEAVGMTNLTKLNKFLNFQDMSSGLVSTPRDYGNFVAALYKHELLNETTRSQMFSNAWPKAKKHGEFAYLHSRYGLATWYECPRMFSPTPWDWSECASAKIFADAGAAGSYPLIDLHNKYWFHFAYQGLPALGFAISGLFRDVLKPLVDAAVTGIPNDDASIEVPQERIACLEAAQKQEWVNYTDAFKVVAKLQC